MSTVFDVIYKGRVIDMGMLPVGRDYCVTYDFQKSSYSFDVSRDESVSARIAKERTKIERFDPNANILFKVEDKR